MSTQVANLNIGGLAVGQSSSISFGQALPPPTIQQQMNASANVSANLFLFNESGSGLRCTLPVSGESFTLAAGQWRIVLIPPNEQQLNFTVVYVLANAPVTQLLADLYLPGETVDAIGVLGNSPIGLSAVSLPVTQVIQDGQPIGQTILESTPTAHAQTLLMTTDGNFIMAGALTFGGNGVNNHLTFSTANHEIELASFKDATTATGILFITYNNANVAQFPLSLGAAGVNGLTQISNAGVFSTVAGQATAGSFGVPCIIAQTLNQHIGAIGVNTILTISAPATGLYRMSAAFTINNGGGTAHPSITVNWTDPNTSAAQQDNPVGANGVVLGGGSTLSAGFGYEVAPVTFYAKTGTTISLNFNDPAGTPNDWVTAMLERLA